MTTLIGGSDEFTVSTLDEGRGAAVGDIKTNEQGVFVYVQANGAIDAQDAVVINSDGQAIVVSNTNTASAFGDRVGVANVAFADNDYGYVQVYGVTTVNVLANAAANAQLNGTATDGTLDDDATAGSEDIVGLTLNAANGGSTAAVSCQLNYPYVGATN